MDNDCSNWNKNDGTALCFIQYLLCRKCCRIAAPSFGADGVIIFSKQPEWIRGVISAEPELSAPQVMMHRVFTLSYWISTPEYNAVASMHYQSLFFFFSHKKYVCMDFFCYSRYVEMLQQQLKLSEKAEDDIVERLNHSEGNIYA